MKKSVFFSKYLVMILLVFSIDCSLADAPGQSLVFQQSEKLLSRNLFDTLHHDKGQKWLSVGMGAYLRQYYSRDTFITFKGARHSENLRPILSHAIDWFGEHQLDDGYIPIWYRESTPIAGVVDLNMYLFAPYNRSANDGGIRQVDHVAQFIEAIFDDYSITGDKQVLAKRYTWAEKAWRYLYEISENDLITTKRSVYAGPDWADQISRSGKAAFVNAYWYHVTVLMAQMSDDLGLPDRRNFYDSKVWAISSQFNTIFWRQAKPTNCEHGLIGYYASWVDGYADSGHYFELDSNSLAVAVGLADPARAKMILNEVSDNFDYFVNPVGATRVLCGTYAPKDTTVKVDTYHNGGYWYIVSYYLAAALSKYPTQYKGLVSELQMRTNREVLNAGDEGLNEWYDRNGRPMGGKTYSWSIAFPMYLNALTFH